MKKEYEFLDQINFPLDLKKIPEINLNARPSELKPEIYFKITELYEREN